MTVADYVACAAASGDYAWLNAWRCGETLSANGPAFAGEVDGELIGVAGLASGWPGTATAWAIVTPHGRAHPRAVHRLVVEGLRFLIDAQKLRRVQADVIATFDAGRKWVERMGFERESLMRKYGPQGQDFIRYVLFPEGTVNV